MAHALLSAGVLGALAAVADAGSAGTASRLSALSTPEMSLHHATLQQDDVAFRGTGARRSVQPMMLVSIMAVSLAAVFLILHCMKVISGSGSGSAFRRLAEGGKDPCSVSVETAMIRLVRL
ncbi:hypothetical protein, conserved [Eimeria brunetti]|uniref:Uncharacterized protein n=1 Tax=Eimeria brunetti TaxID=51314 RepID=U6LEZ7_9EIME|nr:hypothetical protein, conserved [Eimeria brunetti]